MTANQIAYARVLEDQRFHDVSAKLTQQQNLENERYHRNSESLTRQQQGIDEAYKQGSLRLEQSRLAETVRANKASERNAMRQWLLGSTRASEEARHNAASEQQTRNYQSAIADVQAGQLRETQRYNTASNRIAAARQGEELRHNMQQELLTQREQQMRERISYAQMQNELTREQVRGTYSIFSSGIKGMSRLAETAIRMTGGRK